MMQPKQEGPQQELNTEACTFWRVGLEWHSTRGDGDAVVVVVVVVVATVSVTFVDLLTNIKYLYWENIADEWRASP